VGTAVDDAGGATSVDGGVAVAGSVGTPLARTTGAAVGLGDGSAWRPESAVQAVTRSQMAVKTDGHMAVRAPGDRIPQQLTSRRPPLPRGSTQ
jgi:hypothetical protein